MAPNNERTNKAVIYSFKTALEYAVVERCSSNFDGASTVAPERDEWDKLKLAQSKQSSGKRADP